LNLRTKILLFVAACIALFCLLVVALAEFILLPGADRAEAQAMVQNLHRFQDRMEGRLSRLSQSALDWAYWDDTGDYIEGRRGGFVRENLDAVGFKDSNIELLLLWDKADRPVVARMVTRPNAAPVDLPAGLLAELGAVPKVFQRVQDAELSGFTRTSAGVILVNAQPVFNSRGDGPVRGTVLVGSFLGDGQAAEWREHEPFSVRLLTAAEASVVPGRPASVDGALAAYVASESEIVGRWPLPDLKGGVAAVVELRAPRAFRLQQMHSIRLVLVAMGISSVLLAACRT
jgi:sensor domain CHASE-containing protein